MDSTNLKFYYFKQPYIIGFTVKIYDSKAHFCDVEQ